MASDMNLQTLQTANAYPQKPQDDHQPTLALFDEIVDYMDDRAQGISVKRPYLRSYLVNNNTRKLPPKSFLHMLPGELRNQIYHLVGFPRRTQYLITAKMPELATAIPSLAPEILAMLFSESIFEVDAYSKLMARDELTSSQRVNGRGKTYGTGKLAIPNDSWVKQVDPRIVRLRRVRMNICEIDGAGICMLNLSISKSTKRGGPRMSMLGVKSQHLKSRLLETKRQALRYVSSLRDAEEFPGFSLRQLGTIAAIFADPEKTKDERSRK